MRNYYPTLPTVAKFRIHLSLREIVGLAVIATAVFVLAHANAYAQTAGGDTLGGRMQAGATDLQTGGSYVLDLGCYIFAGAAGIAAGYTFWQHHKNPNGQHRLGYAIGSLVVAGFFATMPSIVNFSSQTVSAGNASVTGAQQQLTFTNGGG